MFYESHLLVSFLFYLVSLSFSNNKPLFKARQHFVAPDLSGLSGNDFRIWIGVWNLNYQQPAG
ncbi:MAG: hypothetical protein D6816_16140 [Bacteroidetes bacterium]|nr:MAG: hypothetical protein D6816_16140 [Bacteroidota bacterium]